jgi:hypothetical protein
MRADSVQELQNTDGGEPQGILHRFFPRFQVITGWAFAFSLLVLTIAPHSVSRSKITQATASPSLKAELLARPCKTVATGTNPGKGTRKKKSDDLGANSGSACLEVRSKAIDVQEFLQAYGREQKWNLSDEHVAEDAWTFSRRLERDELLRDTQNDANTDRINWTFGVAFVQAKTTELDEGFVRVQIAARFQGYGQSLDRFAPQKEFWPLSSNGSLEKLLISTLEMRFKNAQ